MSCDNKLRKPTMTDRKAVQYREDADTLCYSGTSTHIYTYETGRNDFLFETSTINTIKKFGLLLSSPPPPYSVYVPVCL